MQLDMEIDCGSLYVLIILVSQYIHNVPIQKIEIVLYCWKLEEDAAIFM